MKSHPGTSHYARLGLDALTAKPVSRIIGLFAGGIALVASVVAPISNAAQSSRFEITGSSTLVLDQPVQKSGNVQLKAALVPEEGAISALSKVQAGGGFSINASLAAASMACYNDTIFRDGFDGDGQ
jgi:hypothetical protein